MIFVANLFLKIRTGKDLVRHSTCQWVPKAREKHMRELLTYLFFTLQEADFWLDSSVKSTVLEHPLNVSMLKGPKHL